MEFDLEKTISILSQTPSTLAAMLNELPDEWLQKNEGGDSWSPINVISHLIHGEQTDWIERVKIILSDEKEKNFKTFDRAASIQSNGDKSIKELTAEFNYQRNQSLDYIKSLHLSDKDFLKTGVHPEFGEVTLKQLLATWAVHDLGHIAQISRVMAKQYTHEVGPWINYLSILTR
ncbi:hypothetical protein AWW67_00115 [Roseivirga seohaensis]|uniref:DinB-like domain-containing protein n=1 Tax=Roseivirga seohaensis TaxID=1914963 RepID=A0A150Y428_9BACT|nr:DinB family protein [Roseivirga seohaensis]KYG85686.1 hypothetical protein AWW67_00115 [Roseivirga seohaensis]